MSTLQNHILTSREFGHNVSKAKLLAKEGPVFITDRGNPTFVLIHITEYRTLTGEKKEMSLLDLMDSLPDSSEVENFEIEPVFLNLRVES